MSRALHGWVGLGSSCLCAMPEVLSREKFSLAMKPKKETRKQLSSRVLQRSSQSLGEPGTQGRATGDVRPLLSVGQAKVWQRTTLKRTKALPHSM